MANIEVKAILPKTFPGKLPNPNDLTKMVRSFVVDVQQTMMRYPAAMPWTSTPPSKGIRKGGRRTGSLKRRWSMQIFPSKIVLSNRTPYAGYVEGYTTGGKGVRQTSHMAARGWPSLTNVIKEKWAKHFLQIKQQFRYLK